MIIEEKVWKIFVNEVLESGGEIVIIMFFKVFELS